MSTPFAAQIDGGRTVRHGREQWLPYGDPNQHARGYDLDEETVRFDRRSTGRRPGRRRTVWVSLITAILVASGVVGGGFFLLGRTADAPAAAVVGDCLARSGSGAVIVSCTDPQAAFTVLGRLGNRTRIEAGITACSPFPATTDVYWQGKEGVEERGLVLCLGPAQK